MPKRRLIILFSLILSSISLVGHAEMPPENMDFVGGYFDDGEYKCYQEPCFSIHKHSYPSANNIDFDHRMWPRWLDVDRNCQKENHQAMAEASLINVRYENGDQCRAVTSGQWQDPYTGRKFNKVDQVEVDDLVSLHEAHSFGGLAWPRNKRALFANNPNNLIVVSREYKEHRAGRPASEWMPADESYWCEYIVKRELIARKFELHFPSHEREHNHKIKTLYCKY